MNKRRKSNARNVQHSLPFSTDANITRPRNTCFNYGEANHRASECTKPRASNVTCYNCGEKGHYSKDCPKPRKMDWSRPQNNKPPPQKQNNEAKIYAMVPEQAGLEGTITLFNNLVKVLFDTGATHSFITSKMVKELGLIPERLSIPLAVSTPSGITLNLHHICKNCLVSLENRCMPAQLVVLTMN